MTSPTCSVVCTLTVDNEEKSGGFILFMTGPVNKF